MRAFFGLPVPDAQRVELGRHLAACAAKAPEFRWVSEANLHLTMRFLGNVTEELVAGVASTLSEQKLHGFDVELGHMGAFKRGRLVRVVWIGMEQGLEPARGLASIVEAACVGAGLEAETRPFQPHLTLARARGRDGAPLPPLPDPPRLPPWRATGLVLYQSHLGRPGAVYEPLRTLRLE
ncbi:MAG TPA: RNA 2',3'-cyclic phosphodiesterase [Candidatus Dormibacteraeota bacterium]|nr:RNA 2',3'-cyclic phosphodiesterase [Candidatus Dormibacteraeota bacterium]